MEKYIIQIEKEIRGSHRYQIMLYKDELACQMFEIRSDSFKEMVQHAVGIKEALEKQENIELPFDIIRIEKSIIDEYKDIDTEMQEFMSKTENYNLLKEEEN